MIPTQVGGGTGEEEVVERQHPQRVEHHPHPQVLPVEVAGRSPGFQEVSMAESGGGLERLLLREEKVGVAAGDGDILLRC
jgi:hypothetical protein